MFETLTRGLMRPNWGMDKVGTQLGYTLGGGYEAERAKIREEERQKQLAVQAMQKAIGAKSMGDVGGLLSGITDPKAAMRVAQMGQIGVADAARQQEAETIRQQALAQAQESAGIKRLAISMVNKDDSLSRQDKIDRIRSIAQSDELAQSTLKQYQPGKDGGLVNAGGGALYDPNTKQWLTAPKEGEWKKLNETTLYNSNGETKAIGSTSKEAVKETNAIVGKISGAEAVLGNIAEARKLAQDIIPMTWDVSRHLPSTSARALDGKLNSIKANLGFDKLQAMREASKTGGALGAVSERENILLQSTVANLDPASDTFPADLKKVEMHYQNFLNALIGKPPVGDNYVEDGGRLYYFDGSGYTDLGVIE